MLPNKTILLLRLPSLAAALHQYSSPPLFLLVLWRSFGGHGARSGFHPMHQPSFRIMAVFEPVVLKVNLFRGWFTKLCARIRRHAVVGCSVGASYFWWFKLTMVLLTGDGWGSKEPTEPALMSGLDLEDFWCFLMTTMSPPCLISVGYVHCGFGLFGSK
jgi:hypothetical protein